MAGFNDFPEVPTAGDGFDAFPEADGPEVKKGSFLPISVDTATGERSFDPTAGVIGDIMRAFDFGIKASRGDIDLSTQEGIAENIEDIVNMGVVMSPMGAARGAVLGPSGRSVITGKPRTPPVKRPTAGTGPAVVEAGERIGVDVPGGAATDVMGIQQTGRIVADIPVVGTPLRTAAERAQSQLGEAATAIEQGFGSGRIPKAGETAREGLTTFITDTTRNRVAKRYNRVDELVNDAVPSPLSATAKVADDIAKRRANANLPASPATGQIQGALDAGQMNYQGIKDLRTTIGEQLDSPSLLPAGTSKAELKRVYGALTDDLRAAARAGGGKEAVRRFDEANAFNNAIAAERKQLNKLIGRDTSDEALFDRIIATAGTTSRANLKLLQNIRRAVSKETFNEIGSAVIHKMGRDAEGNFSPSRFITAWGKLSPQGKGLLFRSTGRRDLAAALDDLAKVSSRFKQLEEFANPPKTGSVIAALGGGFNLATLDPTLILGTVLGGGAGRIYSTLLSKPASARALANWAKAYERTILDPRRAARNALQSNAGRLATLIALDNPEVDAQALASQLQTIPQQPAAQQPDGEINPAPDRP